MKIRYPLFLISVVSLVLCIAFFSWLEPNCAAPIPEPSRPGGYYDDSFLLVLTAPESGKIYYTTDGSDPSTASTLYQEGIFLQNRSSEQNHYNAYRNVRRNWLEYTPDPTPVPKGTVIRAIFVNDWGITSEILTQTYFVGIPEPESGYTVSLVFNEEDLFGEDGIYITGKEYDDWYLSHKETEPEPVANFNKRLEVPVISQFFDNSGEIMNQMVSLRLQGASKRGWIQKRFILEASSELSGSNVFPTELFPGTATHSIMTKDGIIDAMVHDMVSDRNVALQKSDTIHLYLNGEFLYNWNILERYDNQYFRQYFQVDNVMLVKNGIMDEDVTIDADAHGELMYWVGHTDFTDPEQWAQLNLNVDLQSYIDFICINYYLCNWDFNDRSNHLMWRSAVEETAPYGDKRWRWCIYDIDALEFTLNNYDVENAAEVNIFSCDPPYSAVRINEATFFRALKPVEAFRRQFVLSFMDIVNNNFAPHAVSSVLEKHGLSINWMDGYFLKRPAYAAAHLAEEFELTGTLETVSIVCSQPHMGTVTVNTSNIDLSAGSWSGNYFTDYPITITAQPKDGYEFVGWKGAANGSEHSVTVHVDGGIVLEAVFAPI